MKLVLFIIFSAIHFKVNSCTSLEEKAIRCDQHCISKQEPESWLKDNKFCICGEQSEPSKPIFKVKSNVRGKAIVEEKRAAWEE